MIRRALAGRLFWIVAALCYMGTIFYLSSGPIPVPARLARADWLLHGLEYFLLGWLWSRALPGRSGRLLGFAIALLWGASDELHQLFVPLRGASWHDLAADGVGALLGSHAAYLLSLAGPAAETPAPRRKGWL